MTLSTRVPCEVHWDWTAFLLFSTVSSTGNAQSSGTQKANWRPLAVLFCVLVCVLAVITNKSPLSFKSFHQAYGWKIVSNITRGRRALLSRGPSARTLLDPDSENPAEDFTDCNYLNNANYNWVGRPTKGEFDPYKLHSVTQPMWSHQNDNAFRRESSFLIYNETVFYIGADSDEMNENIYTVLMDSFSFVYSSTGKLDEIYRGGLLSMFEPLRVPPEDLFQQDYTETGRHLVFNSNHPRHIMSDGDYVTWIELIGGAYDVRLHSMLIGANIPTELPPTKDIGLFRLQPAVCNGDLMYQEFDPRLNQSNVFLFHYSSTRTVEMLHPPSSRSYFYPQFAVGLDDDSGTKMCTGMWLESEHPLVLGSDLFVQPLRDSSASAFASFGNDIVVHLMLFPSKVQILVPPSSWRLDDYTVLQNIAITINYAAFVLTKPDLSSYLIRIYNIRLSIWQDDKSKKVFLHPVIFSGAHQDGFLFWTGSDVGGWSLHVLKTSVPAPEVLCRVLKSDRRSSVPGASIYKDMIFWQQRNVENQDVASIYRLDIDKDNDLFYDTVDLFPLLGEYTTDSDNDGIGDEGDFITATGPCVIGARNACMSDYTVMYIAYGVFMFILVVALVIFTFVLHNIQKESDLLSRKASDQRDEMMKNAPKFSAENDALVDEIENWGDIDDVLRTGHPQMLRLETMRWVIESLMMVLVLLSVILAIVPYWDSENLLLRTQRIFAWVDFLTTNIFLLDLIMRYVFRDKKVDPNLRIFLYHNWYDVPSLVTDVPGLTTVGLFHFAVVARIGKILRVLRMFKLFRIIRLYRRITNQSIFVLMMIERPTLFLSAMTTIIILALSVWLKILEQDTTPAFGDFLNVVWFSLVTVCTIGYGDLYPNNTFARVISMVLAFLGIGLLGAISAKMVHKILHTNQSEQRLFHKKKIMAEKHRADRMMMERMCQTFNPINVNIKDPAFSTAGNEELLTELLELRLMRKEYLDSDAVLFPLEEMMAGEGTGGKFGRYDPTAHNNRNSRLLEQAALADPLGEVGPNMRVRVVLQYYGLHKDPKQGGIGSLQFEHLAHELYTLLLSPPKHYTTIEKVFTILSNLQQFPDCARFDAYDQWDTLWEKERLLDEIMTNYKVSMRHNYVAIRRELHLLMLRWERLTIAKWAMQNLRYKNDVKPAPPLTNPKHRELPSNAKKPITWHSAVHKITETRLVVRQLQEAFKDGLARKRASLPAVLCHDTLGMPRSNRSGGGRRSRRSSVSDVPSRRSSIGGSSTSNAVFPSPQRTNTLHPNRHFNIPDITPLPVLSIPEGSPRCAPDILGFGPSCPTPMQDNSPMSSFRSTRSRMSVSFDVPLDLNAISHYPIPTPVTSAPPDRPRSSSLKHRPIVSPLPPSVPPEPPTYSSSPSPENEPPFSSSPPSFAVASAPVGRLNPTFPSPSQQKDPSVPSPHQRPSLDESVRSVHELLLAQTLSNLSESNHSPTILPSETSPSPNMHPLYAPLIAEHKSTIGEKLSTSQGLPEDNDAAVMEDLAESMAQNKDKAR